MKTNVVILSGNNSNAAMNWSKIGKVVSELAELYQIVKESEVDLIIVGEDRTDLPSQVAVKIRRYNGLTDIWKVTVGSFDDDNIEKHYDGSFSIEIGEKGITKKVTQILQAKELLAQYSIIARSAKMKLIAETIHRIAPTDVPVLIVGQSGTGKELVAKAIHKDSQRESDAFVAINCGAIAEGLLESELFGHEKGAFTGSVSKREGLFKKANNGIIFLDEIGETKSDMQVKLLRVLEDGTYYPV
ncbi:MAG TPA: sigma-54 factor interaction domain-containing protein, partial [candidate division Zixibacteria bacterium]|nr:sigma-54 factor interaction domain-containing protein [candidate division Zixibacteria bacterium]